MARHIRRVDQREVKRSKAHSRCETLRSHRSQELHLAHLPEGVLPLGEFGANKAAKDGKEPRCGGRDASKATRDAAVAQTIAAAQGGARAAVKACLQRRTRRGAGFSSIRATGEYKARACQFQRADFAVRLLSWPGGLWLPVQLKSNGEFDKHGKPSPTI